MIKKYLCNNILITDGAMGTYYAEITGNYNAFPEFANINEPEIIAKIHSEYINAGAKLIKTNTFSANSLILNISRQETEKIVDAAVRIARSAVQDKNVFVAASIGPVPESGETKDLTRESISEEYKFIIDLFLARQINIFIFETFSDVTFPKEVAKYIKEKDSTAFIMTEFASTADGFTRKGLSAEHIAAEVKKSADIDAYGFNCGVGPSHILNTLRKIDIDGDIVGAAPNAGYPEIMHERTVYIQNKEYFAERMQEISALGVKILGGCCGTTPAHIEQMVKLIKPGTAPAVPRREIAVKIVKPVEKLRQTEGFFAKMKKGKFVIAVELDPPFNADCDVVMKNALICKEHGVDLVTIADSPMGKVRVDSIILAAKIQREAGIETMPHVCCRDENINALKSSLLAAHIEGIRNILAVTGDPVAAGDKNEVKGVFNLNSFRLIELISIMNSEVFARRPLNIGGALNLNAHNPDGEVARMRKKVNAGAEFFLTQPIYEDRILTNILPQLGRRENVKILGGIMPLVSYRNAQFLNNELSGIKIPSDIIKLFDPGMSREDAEDLGVGIAVQIAGKMKDSVDGFYFITPFNRVEMIMKIIKKL